MISLFTQMLRSFSRNLTMKLSILVTLAVMLVLLILGVYFDIFLRNSFLESTNKQIQHAFQRLAYNLENIEAELKKGSAFAQTDERLNASIELIDRYQDKSSYSVALIDEEKKAIAFQLLERVKLSLNREFAIYSHEDELIAFAKRQPAGYQMGYMSFVDGKPQVLVRMENEFDFHPTALLANSDIKGSHVRRNPAEKTEKSILLTYSRFGDKVVIKGHQNVFDAVSGRLIAHLELSNILDHDYFTQLSKDMGMQITHSFSSAFAKNATIIDNRAEVEKLTVAENGNHYIGVMQKDIYKGPVYFTVTLDKNQINDLVSTHRYRFLIFMSLVAAGILLFMRQVIQRSLARPLNRLMGSIQKIEQGDYQISSPVATGDELEAISISVNTLALAVNERETSLHRARNEQEYISLHDSLTGLPNRRLFAQSLEHAIHLARLNQSGLAILSMDMDQFNQVNDTLGHDVGDRLLMEISEQLQKNVGSAETLAHIGADEFNVLIENVIDVVDVERIVWKYMALFQHPFNCGEHEISITASAGIAMYPKDGGDSLSLIKSSDLALYKAKSEGTNSYKFYSDDLSKNASQRAEMVRELKKAVEAGDQFRLVYQPKISAQTGRVVSAEALIRWESPHFGSVPPVRFITLAEETGLIIAIGDWVIHQGCQDLAVLQALNINLHHISMNVSNVQLRSHDLASTLREALEENGLQARKIELEITESYIAKDSGQAISSLHEFRAMGLLLAIDDFGTGYSSLSYLRKLPFTRLKIDKSFVDGLPDDQDSVAVTRAIIGLAKTFGLSVTAEGVESEGQLHFLQQEQCDEIQGYYYAKPMPLKDFIIFCRENLA